MVSGSASRRLTTEEPATSGVSGWPMPVMNSSSVLPDRAAYARIPSLPTSPAGVIAGRMAVTLMPRPARRDSSAAYPAMIRWVAFAPAYPPLAGDPKTAAPLEMTTTRLPGGSGASSAAFSQPNAILTSACQWTEKVSHVCSCSGRLTGIAPATRTSVSGWWRPISSPATPSRAASVTSPRMPGCALVSPASASGSRATATTEAPASSSASAMPRPIPLLAPTTRAILPDRSLITVLLSRCAVAQ
jgi:hypothetical protein